jgi:uncharacterized membrane protein
MNFMGRVIKYLVLWLMMGMCYAQLELFARGVTYLPMTFIGGLAGILIGLLDRHPSSTSLTMWQQCVLGTLIVLDIEFISGYICNMRLGMQLWDYSGYRYNIDGQVCARLAAVWFFIVPLASWIDDFLRWKLFDEPRPKPVWNSYKRLITFR